MNKELLLAIEGVNNKSLAANIKNNSKFAIGGVFFGAIAGFVIASFTGGNRTMYASAGAIIAGLSGYVLAPNEK